MSRSALTKFEADSLWNYELGIKSAWFDNALILNGSAYYIKWSKVQQQIDLQCGFNITANFGTATSKGVEVEVNYHPIKSLNLRLTGNKTQAELGNDVPGTPAKSGDQLVSVPKWAASASADYNFNLSNNRPAYMRVDYSYTGSSISLYDRTSPFYQSKAYSLVNLRLGIKPFSADSDSHWSASVFMDNVFNKIGQTSLPEAISTDLSNTRRVAITRPRTIGINLNYRM